MNLSPVLVGIQVFFEYILKTSCFSNQCIVILESSFLILPELKSFFDTHSKNVEAFLDCSAQELLQCASF